MHKIELLPDGVRIHHRLGAESLRRELGQVGAQIKKQGGPVLIPGLPANSIDSKFSGFAVREPLTNGDPDWSRTSDLQLRRLTLYPAELRDRSRIFIG